MVLVFGMTVVGCDIQNDEDDGTKELSGTVKPKKRLYEDGYEVWFLSESVDIRFAVSKGTIQEGKGNKDDFFADIINWTKIYLEDNEEITWTAKANFNIIPNQLHDPDNGQICIYYDSSKK
jgi:hypothetical protein